MKHLLRLPFLLVMLVPRGFWGSHFSLKWIINWSYVQIINSGLINFINPCANSQIRPSGSIVSCNTSSLMCTRLAVLLFCVKRADTWSLFLICNSFVLEKASFSLHHWPMLLNITYSFPILLKCQIETIISSRGARDLYSFSMPHLNFKMSKKLVNLR